MVAYYSELGEREDTVLQRGEALGQVEDPAQGESRWECPGDVAEGKLAQGQFHM